MTTRPPVRLRPEIAALAAYRQGRVPPEGGFKLSSNENPFPPLPQVAERVAAATALNRYPDGAAVALRERLAARHGVDAASITWPPAPCRCSPSSSRRPPARATRCSTSWRSFEAYPGLVTVAGATSVRVPNDADGGHDIDAMIAAVTERTRVVIVCSPNNPTGAVVPRRRLRPAARAPCPTTCSCCSTRRTGSSRRAAAAPTGRRSSRRSTRPAAQRRGAAHLLEGVGPRRAPHRLRRRRPRRARRGQSRRPSRSR